MMSQMVHPMLVPDAVVCREDDALVVETPELMIRYCNNIRQLDELLRAANGVARIDELAAAAGVSVQAALRLLEPLVEEGVIYDTSLALNARDDSSFLAAFMAECRILTRSLPVRPFWRKVLSGTAPMSLVLGWGIEFTHFVEAANEYMPAGIAHCRSGSALREAFARHYIEEANHSAFFYGGLVACGLDHHRIETAPPLATTRALINQLMELAVEGAVPYSSAFAIMQPGEVRSDSAEIVRFYNRLRALYPAAVPLFDSFERHALVDVDLGHERTLFHRAHAAGMVPPAARQRAIEAARIVGEGFVLFFEGILDAYGDASSAVPRRPIRLFAAS